MLKYLKSVKVLSCLTASSLLFMMTAAGWPDSIPLNSYAWEWTDSAPWSKRTVSTRGQYAFSNGFFEEHDNMYYLDGEWIRIYIPDKYDTDTYISPVNVRFSFSCGLLQNYDNDDYWVQPSYTFDLTSGQSDDYLVTGSLSQSPVINYPVQPPDTNFYWFRVRLSLPTDVPSTRFKAFSTYYTITYDVYYRDGSGGNLPDGWSENTTAAVATLPDDLPTVTTAVNPDNTAEQISGLLKFPSGLLDGMHYLRDTVSQILGLRYVTFIIVLGLICALVAWFLH